MSIYTTLKANQAVTAIVNQSIFVSQASDNTAPPYIVIDYVAITPKNYVKGGPDGESKRASIECVGSSQRGSIDLYEAAREALQNIGFEILVSSYGEYDKVTSSYLTAFDFSCFEHR